MFDKTVENRTIQKRQYSRRQMLLVLGAVGSMTTLGLCGGASVIAYLLGREVQSQHGTESPTQNPTLTMPTAEPHPPEIIAREAWGALPPNHQAASETGFYSEDNPDGWLIYEGELQDSYQTVIIHHSAFYEGDDLSTVEAIQALHRNDRGWADVAYHFMVGRTGAIYQGRDWTVRGTHVDGYNMGSLGICLLGNFMNEQPSESQITSTRRLLLWVVYRLRLTHIATHRDFNASTLCPGDNLFSRLPELAAAANLRIGTEGYMPPEEALECTCCACNVE